MLSLLSFADATSVHSTLETATVSSMADVRSWCLGAGKQIYVKPLERLVRVAGHVELAQIPATEAHFELLLPKATKRRPNPHPGHFETPEAYKRFRRAIQAALRGALGVVEEKHELRARRDAWSIVLDALQEAATRTGLVPRQTIIAIQGLADACRHLEIAPDRLGDFDTILQIDDACLHGNMRTSRRKALNALERHRASIPALDAVLPRGPIYDLAYARKTLNALPVALEAEIAAVIAASANDGIDETSGLPVNARASSTLDRYRAALRHYATTLRHAGRPIDATTGFAALLDREGMLAYLGHLTATQGAPDSVASTTALSYVTDILTVASRLGIDVGPAAQVARRSALVVQARQMRNEMSGSTRAFCERLLSSPSVERAFATQHLSYRDRARTVLERVGGNPARLTARDLTEVKQFGTMAAFAALELRGAPERKGAVLQMKLRGPDRHVLPPDRHNREWRFRLDAGMTKTRRARPVMPISGAGSDILGWYVAHIRPLLDTDGTSDWLFPAPEAAGPIPAQTLDRWMLTASAAIGLPMTPHKFRCGQAARLLAIDWSNLAIAAELLGNSPSVCARFYAWMQKEKIREDTYKMLDRREKELSK